MKWALAFLFTLVLHSCATLVNTPYSVLEVSSFPDSAIVSIENNPNEYVTPAVIPLKRSKQNVLISIEKDSISKQLLLDSKLSPAFTIGNLFSWGLYGYVIDLTNPRRFRYEKDIFINLYDDEFVLGRSWLYNNNKYLNLTLSLPYINKFHLKNGNEYVNSNGFLGFELGLEYYQSPIHYISFCIGTASDYIFPFPVPIYYEGSYDRISTSYISIRQNYIFNRLHFGGGISYINMNYKASVGEYDLYETNRIMNEGIGLSFNAQYRLSKRFYVGLLYQPLTHVYNGSSFEMDYQHFFSFTMAFKFKLLKLDE